MFPRRRRALTASGASDDALVASVSVIERTAQGGLVARKNRDDAWQRAAWDAFHDLGEVRFCARYIGNMLARCRFYVGTRDEPGGPLTPIPEDATGDDAKMRDQLDRIRGRDGTFASLVRMYGVQQFVSGASYLVGEEGLEGEKWDMLSTSELKRIEKKSPESGKVVDDPTQQGPQYEKVRADGTTVEITKDSLVLRFYQRDPEMRERADSPLRPVLDIVEALRTAQLMQTAGDRARLASAGVWLIPTQANLPKAPQNDLPGPLRRPKRLELLDQILEAASAVMQDPGSPQAFIPILAEVDEKYIAAMHQGPIRFDREVDRTISLRIDHLIRRLAQSLDIPPEVLLGMSDMNHWCLTSDVSILTREGWKSQEDLRIGELVLTLNHGTGESEWQPALDIYRADVVDEPMLSMESQSHSSRSTGAHRWPIVKTGKKVAGTRRRWTTSRDGFAAADRVPIAAHCADLRIDPKWEDDFVRLAAAYTADGTLLQQGEGKSHVGRPRAHLTKFDPTEIEAVRAVLVRLFGNPGRGAWTEVPFKAVPPARRDGVRFLFPADIAETLMAVTVPGSVRALTREFILSLTEGQLGLLFDAMIDLGDGHREGDSYMIYQADRSRLEPFELAAILAGRSVSWGLRPVQDDSFNTRPIHWLTVGRRPHFSPHSTTQEWVPYTGTVWCPTTQNGTWLAQHDGHSYFTGNSAWQVAEATIAAHIMPLGENFAEDLVAGFLRPSGEALKVQDLDRYGIGVDPTVLIVAPDKAQHAFELFDRYQLAGEYLLEATGFDEGMQPDLKEIIHRIEIARAANVRNPDPGADIAALEGKAPAPTGAEKPVPGAANQPQVNQQVAEPSPDSVKAGEKPGDAAGQSSKAADKGPAQGGPPSAADRAAAPGPTAKQSLMDRIVGAVTGHVAQGIDRAVGGEPAADWLRLEGLLMGWTGDSDLAEKLVEVAREIARAAIVSGATDWREACVFACAAALTDDEVTV